MPDEPQRIYWDANCFTSYINGGPERLPVLLAILDRVQASKGQEQIVTSVMSKIEVAFSLEEQTRRQLNEEEEDRIGALWADTSVIALVEIHELIVDRARILIREAMTKRLSLGAADAIHLASAMQVQASAFHTYDAKLHNPEYTRLTVLVIGLPRADQPRLL